MTIEKYPIALQCRAFTLREEKIQENETLSHYVHRIFYVASCMNDVEFNLFDFSKCACIHRDIQNIQITYKNHVFNVIKSKWSSIVEVTLDNGEEYILYSYEQCDTISMLLKECIS